MYTLYLFSGYECEAFQNPADFYHAVIGGHIMSTIGRPRILTYTPSSKPVVLMNIEHLIVHTNFTVNLKY